MELKIQVGDIHLPLYSITQSKKWVTHKGIKHEYQ
jgi:hypothetical protein